MLHKALRYKLFFAKALSKQLWKLTKLTKQLIAIIIISYMIVYHQQLGLTIIISKNGKNDEFQSSFVLIAKLAIKTCYFRLFS